ncbi:hypothetical protein HN51_037534 [Arachis hypogaea]|uniref:cyclin-D2-1 isoform X1 n=1 Tax=Arachis ipaensis TaxID=130454 RepID=UPI0007AF7A5F|nr:cyclin-D2-1 isoform X1 [Arachis ipaensis]XP_025638729.1 cyclin-D2-1 isoform X1 [Arachis hypogaea]QHO03090.1 Cyclin [Arachis hypogaea]
MEDENFDPATSSLLCLENNNTCFDDFECSAADGYHKKLNFNDDGSEPFVGFLVLSDETFGVMVEKEIEFLPTDDYLRRILGGDLDFGVRRDALDWICKAHAYYGFGPSCFCLSVNYLDRFLSVRDIPRDKRNWAVQLLALACLSIAAKMEETKMPHVIDMQDDETTAVFDAKTIQRMELMILTTLSWKMQAITPCSFMDYFLGKISREQHLAKSLVLRSMELIVQIIRYVEFLEFRPSDIAAAVAISVLRESQGIDIDKALNCFVIARKDRVLKCIELIRDLALTKISANSNGNLAPLAPQSPLGVLDGTCLSYRSEESTTVGGSFTDSFQYSPRAKRCRSENGPSNENFRS